MKLWGRIKRAIARFFNINVQSGTADMNDESFLEWLGKHGKKKQDVTGDVTYFTCLKMLSEAVAKMPWKLYQHTNGGITEIDNLDVARLMRERPNPFMTPTAFWNAIELNRNHYGNAYVYIRRKFKRYRYGGKIETMDLWIMPSDRVQIVIDDKGYFANRGRIWYVYNDRYSGEQYVISSEDVMHLKTSYSFDGIYGLPVQVILKLTAEGSLAAQEYLTNLYKTGLTAKAVLEYTGELNTEAMNKLREAFEKFGSGAKNTGRIIPIPLGFKLTPLGINLSDAQFIEIRKYTALQIAGAMGIKPNQINDYEKSSYSNSEMQQLSFYVDTMLYILKQYEEEANYKLLTDDQRKKGMYWKLNEKVLLRTDSKTQMQILSQGVNNGIYGVNEARRKLDMQDREGGNRLIVNGNYIPLEEVGKQYAQNAATGAQPPADGRGTSAEEEPDEGEENAADDNTEGGGDEKQKGVREDEEDEI